jgi:hypothetical protein
MAAIPWRSNASAHFLIRRVVFDVAAGTAISHYN